MESSGISRLDQSSDFFTLTPDLILDEVEEAASTIMGGERATGRTWALNSIENRVYEIEFEADQRLIAKFYRPGRWSEEQILTEHEFLEKLQEYEVPVAVPYKLGAQQKTLLKTPNGIYFACFEKLRGKSIDEISDDELKQVGRFLARIHIAGSTLKKNKRPRLNVENYLQVPLDYLKEKKLLDHPLGQRYEQVVRELKWRIESRLNDSVPCQLIHGDCHYGNLLWSAGQCFFVDFDDCLIGPPIQDLWMLMSGRDERAQQNLEKLVEGYEQVKDFDRSSFSLIEPLRALRIIHYSYWIARRWDDPSFAKTFPQFGTEHYWSDEIEALSQVLTFMDESSSF